MAEPCVRVLVVDDHPITRSYFESEIAVAKGYTLAGSLALAEEAVAWCRTHPVDLIILDVLMKAGVDGLTAAAVIKRERPGIKIILTTSTAEANWLKQAEDIGAEGFWYKNYGELTLPETMDRVMAGDRLLRDETACLTLGKAKKSDLTERELEVLRQVVACATNDQIAQAMAISPNTVKIHVHNLLEKTGFTDRLELAVHASKTGFVVSEKERIPDKK